MASADFMLPLGGDQASEIPEREDRRVLGEFLRPLQPDVRHRPRGVLDGARRRLRRSPAFTRRLPSSALPSARRGS